MTSSATSAKEDEVTSSEEAKAFSENESNAEVKGQSLSANSKVKFSHYRPVGPLGLQQVEVLRIYRQSAHEGG
jgi:hypothetical protein